MSLHKKDCEIGMRVQDTYGRTGTICGKWKFEKKDKPPNGKAATYIGVQFDKPNNGPNRHNGTWNGKRLWEAPEGTGELQIPQHFRKEINPQVVKELRAKFGSKIDFLTDNQLVKFAIARKFEMPKVVEMIEKHLAWRNTSKPSSELFFPPDMAIGYPIGYSSGRDKEGNLLYFERPGNGGKVDPKAFVEEFGLATIAKWHICSMETGYNMLKATNFEAERVTCIIDLANLGDCGTTFLKFARTLADIDQNNYPEFLSKMLLINAPGFFTTLWSLLKLAVDERTRNKIKVFGKDYKAGLLEVVDEKYLPSFAGGKDDSWLHQGGRIGLKDRPTDPAKVVGCHPEKIVDEAFSADEVAAAQKNEASKQEEEEGSSDIDL